MLSNPNTSPTSSLQAGTSKVQATTSKVQATTSKVQATTSGVQANASDMQATASNVQITASDMQANASDMQVTTHNSDTSHRPNVNDSITLSAHQLANIQDTLHHYKDGITSIAGVLSVISHNPHLHDYQHQALIDVLQNYCECVLSDIGNPSSKLISSALQETGYYKPSLPNI